MGFTLDNASSQEIVFTIMAALGVVFNAWCLYDAAIDLSLAWKANGSMRAHDRALLRIVVLGNVRAEIVRLLVQFFFLALGILSLYVPPATQPDSLLMTEGQRLTWIWIIWIRRGLMLCTCALSVNSAWNLLDRRNIRRRIHENSKRPVWGREAT